MTGIHFLCAPGNSDFIARCVGADVPSVVSLVGAGGKTSTLFWLAQALAGGGQRVLLTTTTRMFQPEPGCGATLLIEPERAQRLAAFAVCRMRRVSWRCSVKSMQLRAK